MSYFRFQKDRYINPNLVLDQVKKVLSYHSFLYLTISQNGFIDLRFEWVPRRRPRWVGYNETSSERNAREAGSTAEAGTTAHLSTLSMFWYLSSYSFCFCFFSILYFVFGFQRQSLADEIGWYGRTWRTWRALSGWTVCKRWSIEWWLAVTTWVAGLVVFSFVALKALFRNYSEIGHGSYFSECQIPQLSLWSQFPGFAASCIKNDLHKNINLSSPELQEKFWTRIDG